MTNKTPIQELKDWMNNQPQVWGEVMDKIEEALEKEKQAIIDAWEDGASLDGAWYSRDYFNHKYGK